MVTLPSGDDCMEADMRAGDSEMMRLIMELVVEADERDSDQLWLRIYCFFLGLRTFVLGSPVDPTALNLDLLRRGK